MKRFTVLLAVLALGAVLATPVLAADRTFTTQLSGGNEVPAVESSGSGQARIVVSDDGQSIDYKVQVAGLEGIVQAHIHIGAPGENGPVVVFLFGPVPEGVTERGTLGRGTITAADLIGPLAGMDFSTLTDAIRTGNAYVNVHTLAHPMGEIRGQLG